MIELFLVPCYFTSLIAIQTKTSLFTCLRTTRRWYDYSLFVITKAPDHYPKSYSTIGLVSKRKSSLSASTKTTLTRSRGCQKMHSAYGYAAETSSTHAKGVGNIIERAPSSHRVGHLLRSLVLKSRIVCWGGDQTSERLVPPPPQSQTATFLPPHPQKAKYGCNELALHRSQPRRPTCLSATRLGPGLIYSCDRRFINVGNCPLKYCPAFAGGKVHPSLSQRCSIILSASPRSIIW